MSHVDLMAGPPPTHLPVDPATAELDARGRRPRPSYAVTRRRRPPGRRSPTRPGTQGADDVTVYAYARVGYHRSLDLLRRNGWKGHGPGAVGARAQPRLPALPRRCSHSRARAIGETDEWERCSAFLRDSSPAAADALCSARPPSSARTRSAPRATIRVGSRGPRSASTSRW